MKIAFDENVPLALVRLFQIFASEKQLRKLSGDFEFKSAVDYTPRPGDRDYSKGAGDVPWLKRFAADGGKIVISGNTEMKRVPHERLALIDCGFIVIFFEPQWSNWKFFRKCALLLHWWPVIVPTIKRAKKGSFWHIPCNWAEDGKLRKVSNRDPRQLKLERRQKTIRKRKATTRSDQPKTKAELGPLFEYADGKLNQQQAASED